MEQILVNVILNSAKDVFDYMCNKLEGLDREHVYVLLLDCKNRLIKEELVSIGILNASLIHPREVFKPAIINSAYSVILVHNHPSGDCEPSKEDIQITKRLIEIGELINIEILDHIIIGRRTYWSFVGDD